MMRRPLTSIELKLDDLQEYTSKREQAAASVAGQESLLSFNKWNKPPPPKDIHERIGLAQQQQQQQNSAGNKRTNQP